MEKCNFEGCTNEFEPNPKARRKQIYCKDPECLKKRNQARILKCLAEKKQKQEATVTTV